MLTWARDHRALAIILTLIALWLLVIVVGVLSATHDGSLHLGPIQR